MPKGFSTLELLVAMAVIALVTAISIPTVGHLLDRIAVTQSAHEAATFIQANRLNAILASRNVRLFFGSDEYTSHAETRTPGEMDSLLLRWNGPTRLKVSLTVSRSVIRFQPTGIGYGAANTTLVFRRGRAADSLSTSILGRIRRK